MIKILGFNVNPENKFDYMWPVTFWEPEDNVPLNFEQADLDLKTIRDMLGITELSPPHIDINLGLETVTVSQVSIVKEKPVVDTSTITPEEFEQMCRYGIILENKEHKYILNPMLNLFRSISPEKLLEASLNPEDAFLHAYLNMAKCFQLDDKNELVYKCDDRLKTLQTYLSKMDNPKYSRRAEILVEAMWGKELELTDIQFNVERKGEHVDFITLRAHTTSAKCPCCGKISTIRANRSGSFTRKAQDIPITIGRPLYIFIRNGRRFICQNKECKKYGHLFDEQFGSLISYGQRTNRLNALIISNAIDGSFHGAQRILKTLGIRVGDDSIRKMVMDIPFPDDKNIEEIGVDDVSGRKRSYYFTVIYALKDHRLLSILEGRDGSELEKWLDDHPKINLICRDRASAYAKHIDAWAEKHDVEVKQVADRFHLIDNCINHITENKSHSIPAYIAFDRKTGNILDHVPAKTAVPTASMPDGTFLGSTEYDNSPPVDASGKEITFNVSLREEEPAPESTSEVDTQEKGNEQAAAEAVENSIKKQKYDLACAIRKKFDPEQPKKPQYEKLAEEFNIKPNTVKRYICMSQEELDILLVTKPRKKTIKEIDNYKYIIFKMLKNGIPLGNVFWFVKENGYQNSITNLAKYILEIYKIAFPEEPVPGLNNLIQYTYPNDIEVYTRGQIVKHLLTINPKTKKDQFLEGKEEEILKKYPDAQKLVHAYTEFYTVIMGDDVNALVELCKRSDHVKELEGFYKHILDVDLEAVSNAIRYSWSSGFVEGNNNRFKLIKRIGYGRMKLQTLRQKCMLAFWSTLEGFDLGGLIPWLPISQEIDQEKEFWKAMAS